MAKHSRNRGQRKPLVLLVSAEDKRIIKQLGKGTSDGDRHNALLNLMPIIETLGSKPKPDPEPIRLLLPEGFDELLTQKKKETGRSKTDLIVEAAQKYVHEKRRNAETPD
ncbi:MAG: hypothetical protein ACQESR_10395 [Planctomycetota bacterium]